VNSNFNSIQKAKVADIPQLLLLFKGCTDAMLEAGIKQWDYTYPNESTARADITKEECFIIKENGTCLATITLNEQQDVQYEKIGWSIPAKKVLVIHRLAVHPDAQRRGFGKLLTQYASHHARQYGYDVIRLDAFTGNPASNHIYKKLGYKLAEGLCYFHKDKSPFQLNHLIKLAICNIQNIVMCIDKLGECSVTVVTLIKSSIQSANHRLQLGFINEISIVLIE